MALCQIIVVRGTHQHSHTLAFQFGYGGVGLFFNQIMMELAIKSSLPEVMTGISSYEFAYFIRLFVLFEIWIDVNDKVQADVLCCL